MDPLSVSAAIVGLLSAGSTVITLLQSLKKTPQLARSVLLEVNTITTCLRALNRFLNGSAVADRTRTCLVMIDEVRVVLTECVTTFSELKKTLDKLGTIRQGIIDKLKWASKEHTISTLLLRLQGSRMSLNLMMTTLSCASMEQAEKSSRDLRDLVLKTLENDEKLARRLDMLQTQRALNSPSDIESSTSGPHSDDDQQTFISDLSSQNNDCTDTIHEESFYGFAFDKDLQESRVYERTAHRSSHLSLPSSAGQSRGWSFLSDISLSKTSNVSVLSLPVSAVDLYDSYDYHLFEDPRLGEYDEDDASEVDYAWRSLMGNFDCTKANVSWPPWKVSDWMRSGTTSETLLCPLEAPGVSGCKILFLDYGDIASLDFNTARKRDIWNRVQYLQSVILEEVMKSQAIPLFPRVNSSVSDESTTLGQIVTGYGFVHETRDTLSRQDDIAMAQDDTSPPRPDKKGQERKALQIRKIVSQYYAVLTQHLTESNGTKVTRPVAKEKISRLSLPDFLELTTDVLDESLRRQGISKGQVDETEQPQSFLPPKDDFARERNQKRKNLATVPPPNYYRVVFETCCELNRRFPKMALKGINHHSNLTETIDGEELHSVAEETWT